MKTKSHHRFGKIVYGYDLCDSYFSVCVNTTLVRKHSSSNNIIEDEFGVLDLFHFRSDDRNSSSTRKIVSYQYIVK